MPNDLGTDGIEQQEDNSLLDEASELRREVEVKDHLEKAPEDQCGYCGQHFGPDDVFVIKEIYGRTWHFCSEECYRDFLDASDFKDQDLDGYQEMGATVRHETEDGEDI